MNLQSVAISGVAAALTTGTQHDLFTEVNVGAGRKVFRKVFCLRVHTGGLADDVRFDVTNANCNIAFSTRDFDAKGGSTPQVTTEQKGAQALAVKLPAPMQLKSI